MRFRQNSFLLRSDRKGPSALRRSRRCWSGLCRRRRSFLPRRYRPSAVQRARLFRVQQRSSRDFLLPTEKMFRFGFHRTLALVDTRAAELSVRLACRFRELARMSDFLAQRRDFDFDFHREFRITQARMAEVSEVRERCSIIQHRRGGEACMLLAVANFSQMARASFQLRRLILQMQLAQMDQLGEKLFPFHYEIASAS